VKRDATSGRTEFDMHGATDHNECPDRYGRGGLRCKCGKCARCGWPKHTAIHGGVIGGGDRPYGHRFSEIWPPRESDIFEATEDVARHGGSE